MAGVPRGAEVDGPLEAPARSSIAQPGESSDASGPIGRFAGWLDTRGFGAWLVIGALAVAQVAWSHGVLWLSGRIPVGTLDVTALVPAVYAPYALAVLLVAARIARRAVGTFWPATGWPVAEQATWTGRFLASPARLEWLAIFIGLVGGAGAILASRAWVASGDDGRGVLLVAYVPVFALAYGIPAGVLAIVARWLWLVDRIHREAQAIDPFDRAPIYAFSRLTVVIGVALVIATSYAFAADAAQAANLFYAAATLALGVLAFVAPLWGIHDRLADEKERLALDVERRISRTSAEMYSLVDAGSFGAGKDVTDTLEGLTVLRERVARLPTWPWPPQLLSGFLTALLLPILTFVATRVIAAAGGI